MNKSLILCVCVCILTVLRMESYTVIKRGARPAKINIISSGGRDQKYNLVNSEDRAEGGSGKRLFYIEEPIRDTINMAKMGMSNPEIDSPFTIFIISTDDPVAVSHYVDKNGAQHQELIKRQQELEEAKNKARTEMVNKRIAEVSAEYAKERKGGAAASAAGGAEEKKAGQAAEREPVSGAPGGPAFVSGAPKS